jgi:hypothetical protein
LFPDSGEDAARSGGPGEWARVAVLGLAGSPHISVVPPLPDDFGVPLADNCLKLIFRRDVYNNSCSHDDSLNCLGQFWESPE